MKKRSTGGSSIRNRAAILIVSDRIHSGSRPDETGPRLLQRLSELGFDCLPTVAVPDETDRITETLRRWVDDRVDLICVSGGTGLAPRDITPEAILRVIEKRIPGMEEAMRRSSTEITPFGMLSRNVVGSAKKSLIINLPGNPDGAMENLKVVEPVLAHALALLSGGETDHKQ